MSGEIAPSAPIADAWVNLRTGQMELALAGFDGVLMADSENLDALYGKGMVLRATGQTDAAVSIFRKVLDVSQQRLTELRAQHVGHETAIGFENPEEARFMMLGRMIRQRLAELGVNVG